MQFRFWRRRNSTENEKRGGTGGAFTASRLLPSLANENLNSQGGGDWQKITGERRGDDDAIQGRMEPKCSDDICAFIKRSSLGIPIHQPHLMPCSGGTLGLNLLLPENLCMRERKRAYSSCCIGERRREEKRREGLLQRRRRQNVLQKPPSSHSHSVFKSIIVVVAADRKSGEPVGPCTSTTTGTTATSAECDGTQLPKDSFNRRNLALLLF